LKSVLDGPDHQKNGATASRILDVAERLVQTRGFNGYSYADIASELGISKAALHYHFATKEELGQALVDRYSERFAVALAAIDGEAMDAPKKLRAYAELYTNVLEDDRMCLCGILAAEFQTLPESIRVRLIAFFDDNEAWLNGVLDEGVRAGTLRFAGTTAEVARMIVGALEGAMLLARPYDDMDRFRTAAAQLIQNLVVPEATTGTGTKRASRR
jgi:TetR/AcrR family transcriptional regulator, transcriptional repressor for nem operon